MKTWSGTLFHFERETVDGRIIARSAVPLPPVPLPLVQLGAGHDALGKVVGSIVGVLFDGDTVTGHGLYYGPAQPGDRLAVGVDLVISGSPIVSSDGLSVRIEKAEMRGATITARPAWPDTYVIIAE